ncbi:MAG TPA: hypothetical protein VJT74_10640, partial [Pyrinomonadaceae bacterium]|nr:hypothetical protein [Pyrinomonadaceae bacterium]
NMKKFAAILFITATLALHAFGQSSNPPALRIVSESPDLPSELYYGDVKVKPLRFRPGTNTLITIADYDFFIQQQYVDFLRRFPEAEGLKFYLDILNGCQKTDVECIKYTRGALSANFFRSPEFQQKGSFVMYLYMVSLGQRPSTDDELKDPVKKSFERPHYQEFMTDLQNISDPNDDKNIVSAKKDALTVAWLQRTEIQQRFGSLSNADFVQKFLDTAGVTITNQNQLVSDLNAGRKTRAQVLRAIAESPEVNDKFYKQAFVTMQYFGYLRRDPDLSGYVFHNNRFRLTADQAFLENTMVRGFIESPEYAKRF